MWINILVLYIFVYTTGVKIISELVGQNDSERNIHSGRHRSPEVASYLVDNASPAKLRCALAA